MLSAQAEAYPVRRSGRNEQTHEEWLQAIVHSGRVTRVGQHLALILYHVADDNGVAALSMRDLERITGWGRQTIADHLGEIKMFIDVTLGRGRARSVFALQGMITEAIVNGRSAQQADANGGESYLSETSSVREPDTTEKGRSDIVREPDAISDATVDTNRIVDEVDATPDANGCVRDSAQQADAKGDQFGDPSRARIVPPKGVLSSEEDNNPLLPPESPKSKSRAASKRGTRLPCDWELPDEWRAWTKRNYTSTDSAIDDLADNFRDFWVALPGAKATKLDWEATWKNRVREKFARWKRSSPAKGPNGSKSSFAQTVDDLEDIYAARRAAEGWVG